MNLENLKKAGEIAREVKKYAKTIIKPEVSTLEIVQKIESKILELGAKPAFPTNISINEIAAHATPSHNDDEIAHGLLKVDIGCHIDGWIADTAFSVDLENNEENKNLIKSAEEALDKATEKINTGVQLSEIGKIIEQTISSYGFTSIKNLSGHSIEQYNLHAGITIPNHENQSSESINEGVYAIEPFSTNKSGAVKNGKPSGIYHLQSSARPRENFTREVLDYIIEEYKDLPFCSRWIYDKFQGRGLIALKNLEKQGILYEYPQLIEKERGKVGQAEHTIILKNEEKVITT